MKIGTHPADDSRRVEVARKAIGDQTDLFVDANGGYTMTQTLEKGTQLELEMPVAGPAYYPWGHPHGYSYGPHPVGGVGNALIKGCSALDIPVSIGGPVAILSGSRGNRPHCIYRGFCIQGCKVGAKASTLITHVPDAIDNGGEIRDFCMVSRVELGKRNRVTGVHYFDREGAPRFRRPRP